MVGFVAGVMCGCCVGSWFVAGVMLNGCSLGGWFGDWNIWLRDCCLGSWSCGCSMAVCFLFG